MDDKTIDRIILGLCSVTFVIAFILGASKGLLIDAPL